MNYNNPSPKPQLSYIDAIKQYNKDITEAKEIENLLNNKYAKLSNNYIAKLKKNINSIHSRTADYQKRREHLKDTYRKAGFGVITTAAVIGLAAQLNFCSPSYSKKPDSASTNQEETEPIKDDSKGATTSTDKIVEDKVETEYGPVFTTTGKPDEIETNEKYDVVTPSGLEKIALDKNKNLKLNQVEYSVFEIITKNGTSLLYNPILTDNENDGNLFMNVSNGVYKLFPDNKRSGDDGDEVTKYVELEIPKDVEPGYYDLRVSISNDDFRRTKFREFIVE